VGERIFGAPVGQLLGKNLNCLLPGDLYQAQLCEMKRRLDTRKKPVAVQLPGLHQSGEKLVVEMTLGNSSHRGKSVFTAIIRDITRHTR
jgi:PAS domain S-box-containing protein